jgi:hypothetical protein
MTIGQTLLRDIEESQKELNGPNDDTIYRRDHSKRIELINWVLDNMKNSDFPICSPSSLNSGCLILSIVSMYWRSGALFKSTELKNLITFALFNPPNP